MWYFVAIYEQIFTRLSNQLRFIPEAQSKDKRPKNPHKLHQTRNPGYPFVCPSSPEEDILGPECNSCKRCCSVLDIHSVLFWKLSWPSHNIHNPEHSSHHGPHSPYVAMRRDTSYGLSAFPEGPAKGTERHVPFDLSSQIGISPALSVQVLGLLFVGI